MFILHGRRTAKIKKYTDVHQNCKSCKVFDLDVRVYRDYYHLFFIPVFPIGVKTAKINCKNCGEPFRMDSLQSEYEKKTRTPFYLYTIPILFALLIAVVVNANMNTQKEKKIFVENPMVGDVYKIRKDEDNSTTYYFLKLVRINGDTVVTYHNNLVYHSFVSKFNNEDYFVKNDELYFTKDELKKMLNNKEINSVERDYGTYEGFHRIK